MRLTDQRARRTLKRMVEQETALDDAFRALSDRSRRAMIERLSEGPASVSELGEPLSMSLAAVLQHVQALEACGLVRSEKVGRVRQCRLEPATLRLVARWVSARQAQWVERLEQVEAALVEAAAKKRR